MPFSTRAGICAKKGTASLGSGFFAFFPCALLFCGSQKRFAQRLRAGVVVDFGEHLQIAVAQEPRRHIGVHSLGNPKGGPGMAQFVRRKYGNVWMEFVEGTDITEIALMLRRTEWR